MNVIVFGASGQTGRIAVGKLLESGHTVTAFVRDPAKMELKSGSLKVFQGDLRDADAVEAAMKGCQAVFCAIAPRSLREGGLFQASARSLVQAMGKLDVRRIVNLSAWGAGDSRAQAPFLFRAVLIPLLLKKVFEDKEKGEEILMASDLEWVNVRPGRLLNEPARGGVKASLSSLGLKPSMTREDLANFMIEQLSAETWVRRSPLIGY